MKKLFMVFSFLLLGIFSGCFAENTPLPSQSGIVRDTEYQDMVGFDKDMPTVKQILNVEVTSGQFKGENLELENILTGNPAYDIPLKKGDRVILHTEAKVEDVDGPEDVEFFIADIKRDNQLIIFAGIFSILLLAIGRKKGTRSILSIIATVGLIFFVLMPLILNGLCPIASAIFVGILSTIITVYLVGGYNAKSTSAIIGTSASLILAGLLSMAAIHLAHLTGFSGEENMFLYTSRPDLSFTGILSASMIIAALGALMDTSVSIASTINEIHETDKTLSVAKLFKSGMNVGQDIIGTMSNTLILVYMGSSLPLVLLSSNIDLNKFFNLNQVATEILSALIGSISILACVPITAIIASLLIKKYKEIKFQMHNVDLNQ